MTTTDEAQLIEPLTPREQVVLEHLRHGLTNRQIAGKLDISADGVKFHVSSILGKLGVRSRHQAAYWPEQAPWWAGGIAPVLFWWRRTAPAIGGKVSTTTAWLVGGVLFATMAGLALLAVLFMRGRDAGNDTAFDALLRIEPEIAVAQALDRMRGVDSYRMTMTGTVAELATPQLLMRIDYEAPDRYRAASDSSIVLTRSACASVILVAAGETPPPSPTPSEQCEEMLSDLENYGAYEFVLLGSRVHIRKCEEIDVACEEWASGPRDSSDPVVFGVGLEYTPEWPLLILETLSDITVVEGDSGNGLVRLQGLADTELAYLRYISRFSDPVTPTTECFDVPDGENQCIDMSPDVIIDIMENAEAAGTTEGTVWISTDDLLVRRLEVAGPLVSPDYTYMTVEYSDFGNVRVELPE